MTRLVGVAFLQKRYNRDRSTISREWVVKWPDVKVGRDSYDLEKFDARVIEYLNERLEASSSVSDLKREQANLTRIKAELAQIELFEKTQKLISKSEVESLLTNLIITIRTALINIPARLTPQLIAKDDVRDISSLLMREMRELVSIMERLSNESGLKHFATTVINEKLFLLSDSLWKKLLEDSINVAQGKITIAETLEDTDLDPDPLDLLED